MFPRAYLLASVSTFIALPALAQDAGTQPTDQRIVVTGERLTQESSTATRLPVPIRDVPQSVQIVAKELIEDRGITRLSETLETVSGVLEEQGYANNGSTFFNIRGFSTSNTLRDGFFTQGYTAPRDIQAIERIEVVKGPSGVLYGASGSVGGYINTVSKLPQAKAFATAGLTVGSFSLIRPTLDWNQPLGADVGARLNLAYEDNDTFRDAGQHRSFSVAPSLRAQLGPATTLIFVGEYTDFRSDNYDFGIPNVPVKVDYRRYYGLESDYARSDALAGTVTLEHGFSSGWSARVAGYAAHSWQIATQSLPDPFSYVAGTTVIDVYQYQDFQEDYDDRALRSEIVGRFATGGVTHQFLAGAEWSERASSFGGTGGDVDYFVLDLFDEDYLSEIVPDVFAHSVAEITNETKALYAQDLIDFGGGIKVLAGLRHDWITSVRNGVSEDSSGWSPRVGLVYQPSTTTALYGGYSKSILPVRGRSATGDVFDPETAEQFEIGIKQDLIVNRLSATLALFDLTRSGVLTADLDNPTFQIQSGEQRSRGIELDVTGAPVPGWTVAGSFTYLDSEVTQDNSLPLGDALQDAPTTSGSLWSSYEWQEGTLRGLGLGAGVFYVGERQATLPNSFLLDDFVRVDAALYWKREDLRLLLNLRNAFDVGYVLGGAAGVYGYTVMPGRPRSVQASAAYTF